MQKTYSFTESHFDENGFHRLNGQLFTDFIAYCEKDFHLQFSPLFANRLSANHFTLDLVKNSFIDLDEQIIGLDGDFDFDTAMDIACSKFSSC